jgi:deoxyribodipyrimidine photo-lyase
MINIFWFRKDLRVEDNTALKEFISYVSGQTGSQKNCAFIYIKNKNRFSFFGRKRIEFLLKSLMHLSGELNRLGFTLQILNGTSADVFKKLKEKYGGLNVYANRQYEPYCITRDRSINSLCNLNLFDDAMLCPPLAIVKDDKSPYTVYTPFKNKFYSVTDAKQFSQVKTPLKKLQQPDVMEIIFEGSEVLNGIKPEGRGSALKLLDSFIRNKICDYKNKRDFPAIEGTSRLSAHIHFGNVSIRECFTAADKFHCEGAQVWKNQLLWREFYYNITYHFPHIMTNAFQKKYDSIKWENDIDKFTKWKNGETGYPIVDAAMRQLREEGWMHNRLRMQAAMFLTKDLLIDWKWGEKYFAENLIDLDFANNNGGWQWSASTGCDAQPYFRIFNPGLQSKKFDANGEFIKKYIPELKDVPAKYIHSPHLWDEKTDYPQPVVDHLKMKEISIYLFRNAVNNQKGKN